MASSSLPARRVALWRLAAQRLAGELFASPEAAVRGLVAVQSQDYAGAKWALSLRTGAADAGLDALYDAGKILRTHVLRPTWHFVDPADIRWLLELTGPRIRKAMASYNRKAGLDAATFAKSARILEKALRGYRHRTRAELAEALRRGGLDLPLDGGPENTLRLSLLMMQAETDGLICSGPREGKQFTYALLEERAPEKAKATGKTREEALAELARRFCEGHGPAQAEDLAWWSGLTAADARRGLAAAGKSLTTSTIEGKTYWHASGMEFPPDKKGAPPHGDKGAPRVHLLPNYDELFIAFKDRSAFHVRLDARLRDAKAKPRKGAFDRHILFVDGQVAGGWNRAPGKKAAPIVVEAVGALSAAEKAGVEREAKRYGEFLGGNRHGGISLISSALNPG